MAPTFITFRLSVNASLSSPKRLHARNYN
jgi:hypothetical protein